MSHWPLALVFSFTAVILPAAGQEQPKVKITIESMPASTAERVTRGIVMAMTATPPAIDGRLDDACWEQSSRIESFVTASREAPLLPTEAFMCHDLDTLYLAVVSTKPASSSTQPFWKSESLELLFDSQHSERSYVGLVVRPDGRWDELRSGEGTANWRSDARVACTVEPDRWVAEVSLPRRAFPSQENAIWGCNLVRHITGTPSVAATWNDASGDCRDPSDFGHVAFERRPCYVKAARFGVLHRGRNLLNVAIVNLQATRLDLLATVSVTERDGKPRQTPYKFSIPPSQGQWLALDANLPESGRCDVAVTLYDPKDNMPITSFARRDIQVPPAVTMTCDPSPDAEGNVSAQCHLNLPSDALAKCSLSAAVSSQASRGTMVYARKVGFTGYDVRVTVGTQSLEAGQYRLQVVATAPGAGADSANATFTVPGATGTEVPTN
jgi:hypothetical protein